MSTTTENSVATQVYTVYVKAAPEAVWDAITNAEQTDRYGYRGRVEYDLRSGGRFVAHASDDMRKQGAPEELIVGEVIEADAPHKLAQTWNPLFGPPITDEAVTTLTWEIEEAYGATKVTLTHELEGAPLTAGLVGGNVPEMGGGWAWVLSDLKTLLETGQSFEG
jgi:uncharacterized protein YndB with AHSA1/START domain